MKAGPTTVGEITGADEDKMAGSLAGETAGEAMGAVDNMTAVWVDAMVKVELQEVVWVGKVTEPVAGDETVG